MISRQFSVGSQQFERSEDPAKCTAFVAGQQSAVIEISKVTILSSGQEIELPWHFKPWPLLAVSSLHSEIRLNFQKEKSCPQGRKLNCHGISSRGHFWQPAVRCGPEGSN
jgi:hypothetical protein